MWRAVFFISYSFLLRIFLTKELWLQPFMVHGPPIWQESQKKISHPQSIAILIQSSFNGLGLADLVGFDFNPKVATYLHHWWRKSTRSQNTIHLVNSCGVCWDLGEFYPSNFSNFSSQMRLRTHYLVFVGFVWLTRLNSRAFSRHGHWPELTWYSKPIFLSSSSSSMTNEKIK